MDFEKELIEHIHCDDSRVKEAMIYSLSAPGKRIRPKLLFAVLKGFGIKEDQGISYACAIEMVHTYSLIHDDLPAMDNDDLRRGRPTCHKAFDEACAILAGDGLLTEAFRVISEEKDDHVARVCANLLAKAAGANGMVLGQQLDLDAEGHKIDFDKLKRIHDHKTGCLLSVPMMMGCVIAHHEEMIPVFEASGHKLGLAFQIQDDILDIIADRETLGKSTSDIQNDKQTSVTLLGIDKAEHMMNTYYNEVLETFTSMPDFNDIYIREIIEKLKVRNK